MNAFDALGRPIRLGEVVGRGGEAVIYRIDNYPDQIAKIYTPAPRPGYTEKLAWMTNHPPQNPTRKFQHPSLAWPAELLYDGRKNLIGYQMPFIHPAVPILTVFHPRLRRAALPRFDRRYLHRVARNVAAAIGALHRRGYVAGDLNESNVLVTPSALVTLIDTDSFQVEVERNGQSVVHYCPVGKYEYLPPELQGKDLGKICRAPEQDAFALAVLIFQLLMEGNHPFRAQWLEAGEPPSIENRIAQGAFPYSTAAGGSVVPPRNAPDIYRLHPVVVELFRRCFIDGHLNPEARPDPGAWEQAIAEAELALTTCPKGHIYSNHRSYCPDCPPSQQATYRSAAPGWEWKQYSGPAHGFQRQQPESVPASQYKTQKIPRTPPKYTPPPPQPGPATSTGWTTRPAATKQPTQPPGTARPAPWTIRPGQWNSSFGWRWLLARRKKMLQWIGPRVLRSIMIGGSLGALAGVLPGALVAAASRGTGDAVTWSLLFALGGATGGLLRGWAPGYRLGSWLEQRLGWTLLWQGIGMLMGATIGLLIGLLFWWAVFPVVLGLILGARRGAAAGKWLYLAGKRFGWERIWAILCGGGAAFLGWMLAGWAASGGLGDAISTWLTSDSLSLVWTWLLAGALCGGLGGAMGGVIADLFGRLAGLTR